MLGHRKLGKGTPHRTAMIRNLTGDVLEYGRITTTLGKAKEVRKMVEKMITLGKKNDLAARRRALAYLYNETTVTKLFDQISKTYEKRAGGYTRILKLGLRRGDAAESVFLELV